MRSRTPLPLIALIAIAVAAPSMTGCTTRKTKREIKSHEERIEHLEENAEKTDERVTQVEKKIEEFSETAREALERAKEAGASKLIDEQVMTEDIAKFQPGSAVLSPEAKSFLDEFATKLKERNEGVWVEIQGHTDATGDPASNLRLGERRAQAVHDYLAKHGGLPLHRLRTISYGEEKPLGDNKTKEGRGKNRRVVLVVLK